MTCEMIHKNMVHGWNLLIEKGSLVVQATAVSARLFYPKVAQKYEALVMHIATIYEREMRRILQNKNEQLEQKIGLLEHQIVDLNKQLNQIRPTEDPGILTRNQLLMEKEMQLKVALSIEERVKNCFQETLDGSNSRIESLKREIADLQPQYLSEEDVKKREAKVRQERKDLVKGVLAHTLLPFSVSFVSGCACIGLGPVGMFLGITGGFLGTSVAVCSYEESHAQSHAQ